MADREADAAKGAPQGQDRRRSDRRAGEDRRKQEQGPPNGVERRQGERRKGDRRHS